MCLSSLYSQKCQVHFYRLVQVPPRKIWHLNFLKTEKIQLIIAEDNWVLVPKRKKKKIIWPQFGLWSFCYSSVVNRRPRTQPCFIWVNSLLRTHNQEERRRNKTKDKSKDPRELRKKEKKESLDRFEDLTGGKKKKKKIDTHPKTRRDHPSKPTQPMGNKTRTRRTKWRRLSLGKLNLFFIWSKSSRKDLISHATAIFFR